MATAGALPVIGADPEAQKEYTDALAATMKALEARGNNGMNLFSIAGGLLAPTRSGSFGESLGNAATVAGKEMQRDEENAIPLAQMRAQIAGQKLEIANKNKAYGLLGSAMGVQDPKVMAQMVASGQIMPGMGLKFTPELYLALQQLDPKMAEGVKNAATMDVDRYKLWQEDQSRGLKTDELVAKYGANAVRNYSQIAPPAAVPGQQPATAKEGTPTFDFSPLGTGNWTLTSGTGARTVRGEANDHGMGIDVGGVKAGTVANSPVAGTVLDVGSDNKLGNFVKIQTPDGNIVTAGHWDGLNVKKGDQLEAGKTPLGTVGSTGNATGPHIHFQATDANNKPIAPTSIFKPVTSMGREAPAQAGQTDMTPKAGGEMVQVVIGGQTYPIEVPKGIPLADRSDYITKATQDIREQIKGAQESRTAEFKPRIAEISNIDPGKLENSNVKYERGAQLASKPAVAKALGLLYEKGAFPALATAAQGGLKLGTFGLSFDVYDSLKKSFDPEVQKDLRELEMIFADAFIDRAKGSKSAFGPQISNADILFMQAPMASVRDPQKLVLGFMQQEVLKNKQLMDLGQSYGNWLDKSHNTTAHASQYFRSPEYTRINKEYAQGFRDLNDRLNYR